jgi:hypothetical protein
MDASDELRLMSVTERIRHRKLMAAARTRAQKKPSTNPWVMAVKETRKKFPYMNLKEAMVYTKKHYKPNEQ